MSKSTKIIAGLGVAAALGVAALPVASYAVVTPLGGNVDISAVVDQSFTMTIDGTTAAQDNTPEGTDVEFGTITPGQSKTAGATSIVITTNIPDGYSLSAKATGTASHETELYNAENGASIAGFTTAGGTALGGNAGWGIKITAVEKDVAAAGEAASRTLNGGVFNGTTYLAPTTAGSAIDSIAADSIQANHTVTYTVNYGVQTDANQASGTYTGNVTYVATPVTGA